MPIRIVPAILVLASTPVGCGPSSPGCLRNPEGTICFDEPMPLGVAGLIWGTGDFDGDGAFDLLVGGTSYLAVFAEASGWTTVTLPELDGTPAVGDVDGDARHEIATGTDVVTIAKFDDDRTATTSTLSVADVPLVLGLSILSMGSGARMVVQGQGETLVYRMGSELERIDSRMVWHGTPAVGDFDGDGEEDFVARDDNTQLLEGWLSSAGWVESGVRVSGSPVRVESTASGRDAVIVGGRYVSYENTGWVEGPSAAAPVVRTDDRRCPILHLRRPNEIALMWLDGDVWKTGAHVELFDPSFTIMAAADFDGDGICDLALLGEEDELFVARGTQ